MSLKFFITILALGQAVQCIEISYDRAHLFDIVEPLRGWRCQGGVVAEYENVYLTAIMNLSEFPYDVSNGEFTLELYRPVNEDYKFYKIVCRVNISDGCNTRWDFRPCYCAGYSHDVLQAIFNITLKQQYQGMHLFFYFYPKMYYKMLWALSKPLPVPFIYADRRCHRMAISEAHCIKANGMTLYGTTFLACLASYIMYVLG